jgi:hypothetical protein
VLFSGHLLYFEHFLSCPIKTRLTPGAQTIRLRHAVKNTWVKLRPGFSQGPAGQSTAPEGASGRKWRD